MDRPFLVLPRSRPKGNAIGDFNMIDATTGLIIERDDSEGTADKAYAAGHYRGGLLPRSWRGFSRIM